MRFALSAITANCGALPCVTAAESKFAHPSYQTSDPTHASPTQPASPPSESGSTHHSKTLRAVRVAQILNLRHVAVVHYRRARIAIKAVRKSSTLPVVALASPAKVQISKPCSAAGDDLIGLQSLCKRQETIPSVPIVPSRRVRPQHQAAHGSPALAFGRSCSSGTSGVP